MWICRIYFEEVKNSLLVLVQAILGRFDFSKVNLKVKLQRMHILRPGWISKF